MEGNPMKSKTRHVKASQRGNALMEYAVPAAIILLSSGLLITITDATDIMAEYFLSASGRTKSSLQGGTFKTQGLAEDAYGDPGNGLSGFTNFAALKDGNGGTVASKGGGMFFSGGTSRTGARAQPTSQEYLYP